MLLQRNTLEIFIFVQERTKRALMHFRNVKLNKKVDMRLKLILKLLRQKDLLHAYFEIEIYFMYIRKKYYDTFTIIYARES